MSLSARECLDGGRKSGCKGEIISGVCTGCPSCLLFTYFFRNVEENLCEMGTGDAQGLGPRVSVWMMISGKQNSRMGNREVPTPREVYPRMEWYCHGPAL